MNPDILPQGRAPISPGEVLDGKYRVDRVLGVGGMGVVVMATHLQLGQRVALKFMLPEGLRQPGLVERFSREARAAARLRSDHVARVLDVGMLPTGSPYMVMEYLQGSDLAAIVETRGPLPVDVAVDSVLQACDAVAEAHSLGIVHRDLKPRNLFLTERNDGRALVKVLDFGISKDRLGSDLGLTRTTEIMGSPNYMSPEQLKSTKGADERSDIWSLGVILYELLTGRVPFLAETITQLTAMVLTEAPAPIAQLRPDLPRELARAVDHCLEKDPAMRFQSVAELAAALQSFAPPDTRELAARIARIASGGKSNASYPRNAGQASSAGSTSLSWSEKRELSGGRGKTLAIVAGVMLLLGGVAAIGGVAWKRSSLATQGPSAPAKGSTVVLTGAGAGASAPVGNEVASGQGALATSQRAALAPVANPIGPVVGAGAGAAAAGAGTTGAGSTAAAGTADAGAVRSLPQRGPHMAVTPTAAVPPSEKSEPPAGSSQAPKYRTSW